MSLTGQARSIRDAYRVRIENKTSNVNIVADMPESFGFAVNSSFDNLASMSTLASAAQAIPNAAGKYIGGSLLLQAFTKRIWVSSTPIQISLSLLFDAETNAKEDVHDVATTLQALCLPIGVDPIGNASVFGVPIPDLPVNTGGMNAVLFPPNETYLNSDVNRTALWVGRMYYFHSVAIESVHYVAESRFAADNYPIAGQVDITFETSYIYSRQNLLKAAGVSQALPGFNASNG